MIPSAEHVGLAISNLAERLVHGKLADLTPLARTQIDAGPQRAVYRFAARATPPAGPPVLLVPPLAAPALCFDLRRGCSLAEHLVDAGRRVYLVDYGNIDFADRELGIEHWVDDVLPKAIQQVSKDAGGQPVHLVAWCLGGIFSVLTAADKPDLPIASITSVAAPIDVSAVPLVAPVRPLVKLTGGRLLSPIYQAFGGVPRQVVKSAYQLAGFDKYVMKPWAMLSKLYDRDFLAQIAAVDHFMNNMIAYPGRTFGQLYHQVFRSNDLHDGTISLSGHRISLADVRVPTLVIAGSGDGIAPARSVRRLTDVLTSAPEVRFETCPGGHLGVLTGRAARTTTWTKIDDFLAEYAPLDDLPPDPFTPSPEPEVQP